jgi:Ca-activated chloride channel family protein
VHAEDLQSFEATAANRFVAADKPSTIAVRLRLGARTMPDAPRPPINLGLVVDTSGSMEGTPIEDARAACEALLDALSDGDRLAVVAFHSEAEVLLPSTRIDKKNLADIRARIGAMKARGTTDLAGGLAKGLAEVQKNLAQDGINRIVLLGDGVPNAEAPVLPLARTAAQQGISITSLGLGLDYNETLMSAIAQQSGGKYHFIKQSSAVAEVFAGEVLRLSRAVTRGGVLRISPGPGVTVQEVVGLPMAQDGTGVTVALGDMSEEEQRDVIVVLSVPARRAGAAVELMDAEVSFANAAYPAQRLSQRTFVGARASADEAERQAARDRDVERAAARMALSDRIVRVVATARGGNLPLAQSMLDTAEKEARAAAKDLADVELVEKLKTLGPLRQSLPTLVGRPAMVVPTSPVAVQDMARPMAPSPAAIVMQAQAEAVDAIQGR